MITGWGAHHVDIAHWGMDAELTGPVKIAARAEFPKKGLWDVHGPFHVRAEYANGTEVYISDLYPTGVKFIGEDGWIWVARGGQVTPQRPRHLQIRQPGLGRERPEDAGGRHPGQ